LIEGLDKSSQSTSIVYILPYIILSYVIGVILRGITFADASPFELKAVAIFLLFVNKVELSSTMVVGESSAQKELYFISLVV